MSILLTNQAQFCSQNFHKRKIEKSWLPSSILIRYAFQHDFLGLFIPTNNMGCGILSQVENFSFKNPFESRIKRKNVASIHNSFTFHQEPLSALLNGEFWRIFPWNFMYYGKRLLLQTYVLMQKGNPIFKINLINVSHLISYL